MSTSIVDATRIDGAYTADSQRQLVVTYFGGACDVSARGVASESRSSITVHVLLTVLNGVCTAQAIGRTAVAPLSAPWGHRVALDATGANVPVLDGALLLRPSWVPAGYEGSLVFVGGSNGTASASQYWTPPDTTQTPSPGVTICRPTTAAFCSSRATTRQRCPIYCRVVRHWPMARPSRLTETTKATSGCTGPRQGIRPTGPSISSPRAAAPATSQCHSAPC